MNIVLYIIIKKTFNKEVWRLELQATFSTDFQLKLWVKKLLQIQYIEPLLECEQMCFVIASLFIWLSQSNLLA